MKHFLESNLLKVTIDSNGAEMCSVTNKNGLEFIWQADKEIWPRHAPVLFPIVGKLKENVFIHNETKYSLSQHGFARDKDFKLIAKDQESLTFELKSNEETKKVFPFDFIFQLSYHLSGNKLITSYNVHNPSKENILFSVGAHPGFNCPLLPNETFEDYYLKFEVNSFQQTNLKSGLRAEGKTELPLKDRKLFLSEHLFDHDALVFEEGQISSLVLCSNKSAHSISIACKDWPYFGIWSKKDCAKFICLEPWYGIADSELSNQQLQSKKGIITLESDKDFSCSFSLSFN